MSLLQTLTGSLTGFLLLAWTSQAIAQVPVAPLEEFGGPPIMEVYRTQPTDVAAPASAEDVVVAPAESPASTPALDIPLNARVQSFVNLLTGRLKGFLEDGLSR